MTYSPRKPIYLTTFGALAIVDGADASTRSRRALALLALAAAGGPSGADRAGVVGLLWPDSDSDRAANSFRQVLHGIRRDLGEGVIVYEGGCLKLNPSVFSVDLWDFEHAVRCDDMRAVARLYRGPFLGSFHIHGLVEFERWVEAQQERYRQIALATLRRLAVHATDDGDHHDAVGHWRSVVEIDPLSSKNALGLLRAMAHAGDRSGALAFARAYEALVRSELEMEPDQNVSDFVALLRRGSGNSSAVAPSLSPVAADVGKPARLSRPPVTTPAYSLPLTPEMSVSAGGAEDAESEIPAYADSVYDDSVYKEWHTHDEPTVAARGRVNWRAITSGGRKRRIVAIVGAVILFIAAATAKRLLGAATAAAAVTSNLVAVIPFDAYDPADSALSALLAATLAADLDGAGRLHSIPTPSVTTTLAAMSHDGAIPHDLGTLQRAAKKLGAGIIVTGDIVRHGSSVRLSMAFRDTRHGGVIGDQVVVDAEGSDVLKAIDDVTGKLVAERYRQPNEHLTRAALRSTHSVAALKFYLRGESALRDGRYVDAVDEFQRSTQADSTFGLAYYRLAVAADWSGRPGLSRLGTELALRYSDHLDDRDRRLVAAYAAFGDGHGTAAEHAYRAILDDYPDDAEAWFQLGEVLFHNNPLRGKSATEARPAFERLLALDPDNLEAIIHLARIASLQQRQPVADALEQRALQLVGAPHALEQRTFRALALADRPGVRRVSRDLERTAPTKFGATTLLGVEIDADDVFGTARFARALIDESLSPTSRAFGLRLLVHTSLAQGKWTDARAQIDSAMVLDRELAIGQLSLIATMPFVPIDREEVERIRGMVRDWKPAGDTTSDDDSVRNEMFELIRLHRLGVLSLRLGDIESARRAADVLETHTSSARTRRHAHTLAQSIRARVSAEQGHLTEALAALDAADWEGPANLFAAEAADRFFRATLLQALGRTREAAKWYSSIAERAAYELPYLAPAQLRLAGIAQANGDLRAAREHSDRVAQLWRHADTAVKVAFR